MLWHCWFGGRKGIRPVKNLSGGVLALVICLEWDADLHMAQLMPLPLTVSCFSKIQIGFTFPVPAHLGSPGKRAVKRVYVCLYCNSIYCYSILHDTCHFLDVICPLFFSIHILPLCSYAGTLSYLAIRLNDTSCGIVEEHAYACILSVSWAAETVELHLWVDFYYLLCFRCLRRLLNYITWFSRSLLSNTSK